MLLFNPHQPRLRFPYFPLSFVPPGRSDLLPEFAAPVAVIYVFRSPTTPSRTPVASILFPASLRTSLIFFGTFCAAEKRQPGARRRTSR